MITSPDSPNLVPLTLSDLGVVPVGEVESITREVFEKMSDNGEWGQPGYGDQGQFF